MRHFNIKTITFLLLLQCGSWAHAADATATTTNTTAVSVTVPVNDSNNYLGDRIKFTSSMTFYKVDMTSQVGAKITKTLFCIPAYSTLKGNGVVVDVNGKSQSTFIVTSSNKDSGAVRACGATTAAEEGDMVVIDQNVLNSTPPDRYGLTVGTLVVPFKYHLSGARSFTGTTTVGGYMGYRADRSGSFGLALQYIVFLGGSSIPVPQTTNGTTTTQNMTGVSYGVGILGTVKDNFHMGVVLGADTVNASAGYEYNSKPWLAVELGYSFSN